MTPDDIPGGWAGAAAGFGGIAAGLMWLRRTLAKDAADGARHGGERDVISRYREQAESMQAEIAALKAELAEERRLRIAHERANVLLEGECESLQSQLTGAMKAGRRLIAALREVAPEHPGLLAAPTGWMPLQ